MREPAKATATAKSPRAKSTKHVECTHDWSAYEKHTVLGSKAEYRGRFFANGEGHYKLSQSGEEFTSPAYFGPNQRERERESCGASGPLP